MLSRFQRRLSRLLRRDQFDRELNDELQFHLDMKTEANREAGVPSAEARYAAARSLGNPTLLQEQSREVWLFRWLETTVQDLRYAFRMLRRSPGFTIAAALSLGLAIGANTGAFAVLDSVVFEPLPVKDPQSLFIIHRMDRGSPNSYSHPVFERLRDRQEVLSELFASSGQNSVYRVTLQNGGEQRALGEVRLSFVSGNYFSLLGVNPVLGRAFMREEDQAVGAFPVAVISHLFWERVFSSNASAIGATLLLNNQPLTIIGVAPARFFGEAVGFHPDVWTPMAMQPLLTPAGVLNSWDNVWLKVFGRLKDGVGQAEAAAALTVVYRQIIAEQFPERNTAEYSIAVVEGARGWAGLRGRFSSQLWIMMAVVGIAWLIACSNTANLMLARAAARQQEVGIRLALGCGRLRLMRQLLTESLLLAAAGGAFGFVFSFWISDLLVASMATPRGPILVDVDPDLRILAFGTLVSILTGILFGLAPALRSTRLDLAPWLRTSGANPGGRVRSPFSGVLISVQVALSLLLLVGAGLFYRTLENLRAQDTGFDRDVLMFEVTLESRLAQDAAIPFIRQLEERLGSVSGIRSASISSYSLLAGGGWKSNLLPSAGGPPVPVDANEVSPAYFRTLGIELLAGRAFLPSDYGRPTRLAIVNQTLARKAFPGESPLGRQVAFDYAKDEKLEIVGVVEDAKRHTLRESSQPIVYLPLLQSGSGFRSIEVRTGIDASSALSAPLRKLLEEEGLIVRGVLTMGDQMERSLMQERMFAVLCASFALLALVLASVGLYGLVSYGASRRTAEVGLRIALGAERGDVVWLVVRRATGQVLIGIAIGLLAASAATPLVAGFLFGLGPSDPATIAGATILILSVAALAAYLPARRAARIDPIAALRYE